MKNLYKKISVIALSSMIIAGGIASSGVNAQAYSSNLSRQIEDIGKGAKVYHEVKSIAESVGARVEAVFSSRAGMNRYVEKKYWKRIQGKSERAKKLKKALFEGVECGSDPNYLKWKIEEHALGNMFRIRYKGYYFLIRVSPYKDISQIPEVSEQDLNKNLSPFNKFFYEHVLKPIVKKYGARVVKISDSKNKNDMKDYIDDRFEEGIFKGDEYLREELLVGLDCDYSAFEHNLKHRYRAPVMRLIYGDIDMLIIYNN